MYVYCIFLNKKEITKYSSDISVNDSKLCKKIVKQFILNQLDKKIIVLLCNLFVSNLQVMFTFKLVKSSCNTHLNPERRHELFLPFLSTHSMLYALSLFSWVFCDP